jgi:hypothetical protein
MSPKQPGRKLGIKRQSTRVFKIGSGKRSSFEQNKMKTQSQSKTNLLQVVRAASRARDKPWYNTTTLRFRNPLHEVDFLNGRPPPTLLWIITPLFIWSVVRSWTTGTANGGKGGKGEETKDIALLGIGMLLSVTMVVLERCCPQIIRSRHHELWVAIFLFFTLAFFTRYSLLIVY